MHLGLLDEPNRPCTRLLCPCLWTLRPSRGRRRSPSRRWSATARCAPCPQFSCCLRKPSAPPSLLVVSSHDAPASRSGNYVFDFRNESFSKWYVSADGPIISNRTILAPGVVAYYLDDSAWIKGFKQGGGTGGNTGGGSNSVANTKSVTSLASSPLSSIKRPTPDSTPPTEQTTIPSQPGSQG